MTHMPRLNGLGDAGFSGARLARVTSVDDPEGLARVQIRLIGADADAEATLWARVATAFAGTNRGAFLIPDVDDEVLVVFAAGAARAPIVIGSLWSGATDLPEDQPAGGVDRWTLTGKNGTRIAIIEEGASQEKVEIETPAGQLVRVTDEAGGKIRLETEGGTITIDPMGVEISTSGFVRVDASMMTVSASMVTVDTPVANFSGVVSCTTLQATTVVGTTYTPGAGNIW